MVISINIEYYTVNDIGTAYNLLLEEYMSILKYIGSMKDIKIKEFIPYNIETYVEPFAGSFSCGFNLMEESIKYKTVLNDLDVYVVNFWRCIKDNPEKVITSIYDMYSKCRYTSDIEKYSKSADEFELSAYEYLHRANIRLITNYNNDNRLRKLKINEQEFIEASISLMNTDITNKDVFEILDEYDSDTTLFMIDPPYKISSIDKFYRCDSSKFNHIRLCERVHELNGKWIVRYNNNGYTNELYRYDKLLFETCKNIIGCNYFELYFTNI